MLRKQGFTIFIIVLIFLVIRILFGFNGLYGQDAYEYLRYTNRLREFFLNVIAPGDYFWPVGYPLAGALFSLLLQDSAMALQLVSFLSLLITFVYANKILKLVYPAENGTEIYLLLFLVCSPLFLRTGLVCMSDMTAAAFVTGGIYQAFAFRHSGKRINLVLFFVFGAAAFMIRYASPLLLLVPAIAIIRPALKIKYLFSILAGILFAGLIIAPHFLIRSESSTAFLNHPWLMNWSPAHFFRSVFETPDGKLQYSFVNLLYTGGEIFHPGYFIAGILFLPLLFIRGGKIRTEEKILLASAGVYLLFLAGMPIQNSRFFIPVIPLIVLAVFRAYRIVENRLNGFLQKVFVPAILVFQLTVFAFGFRMILDRYYFEAAVFSWLEKNTQQPVLYSFDLDISLKGKGLKKEFRSLFENEYDSFAPNSLVLFNPVKFEKQWTGKNPMLNWAKMKKENELVLLHTFGEGWELYEIR